MNIICYALPVHNQRGVGREEAIAFNLFAVNGVW
jgi:hypothetical protein